MGILNRMFSKKEVYKEKNLDDFLSTLLELAGEATVVNRELALGIPAINSAIRVIAGIISSMDVELCKIDPKGKVEVIKDDYRLTLLNERTGDSLSPTDMKSAIAIDYVLDGNSYVYIEKSDGKVQSLRYVETKYINKLVSADPIFKEGTINVGADSYNPWDFIICCKNSTDGLSGNGILKTNPDILGLAYEINMLNLSNVKSGGIQRGIIYAEKPLSQEALDKLKANWKELYSSKDASKIMFLNAGLKYAAVGSSTTELNLDNISKTIENNILDIVGVPKNIIDNTATTEQFNSFCKVTIVPIVEAIEKALNRALLSYTETTEGYYFKLNIKQVLKGSIQEQLNTWKGVVESGIGTVNEARADLDMEEIKDFNYLRLNLANVLYNTENGTIFVANTGQTTDGKSNVKEVMNSNEIGN